MKGNGAVNSVKPEKAHLKEMIEHVAAGKTSLAKEAFEKVLSLKAERLVRRERSRVANMIFCEAYVSRPEMGERDNEKTSEVLYDRLLVIDSDLFQREKSHMPEWMQEATPEGIAIDPINEKDAIELSSKFHSVEFTSDKA